MILNRFLSCYIPGYILISFIIYTFALGTYIQKQIYPPKPSKKMIILARNCDFLSMHTKDIKHFNFFIGVLQTSFFYRSSLTPHFRINLSSKAANNFFKHKTGNIILYNSLSTVSYNLFSLFSSASKWIHQLLLLCIWLHNLHK